MFRMKIELDQDKLKVPNLKSWKTYDKEEGEQDSLKVMWRME